MRKNPLSDNIQVEIADGDSTSSVTTKAKVSPANASRTTTDPVILVQNIDAAGNVGSGGYAEDSAHVSGDKGTMGLSVRNDTGAALSSADGDYTPTTTDAVNNLRVTQGTLLYFEDATNGVGKVEQQMNYTHITLAAPTTTVVRSGQGLLHAIVINTAAATGVITLYDNTAASGTVIGIITQPAAVLQNQKVIVYNVKFAIGLTIVTATAAQDITVATR